MKYFTEQKAWPSSLQPYYFISKVNILFFYSSVITKFYVIKEPNTRIFAKLEVRFQCIYLSNFEQQFLLSVNSKADLWDLNAKEI